MILHKSQEKRQSRDAFIVANKVVQSADPNGPFEARSPSKDLRATVTQQLAKGGTINYFAPSGCPEVALSKYLGTLMP